MTIQFPTPEYDRIARKGKYRPECEGDDGGPSVVYEDIKDGGDVVEHMCRFLRTRKLAGKVTA